MMINRRRVLGNGARGAGMAVIAGTGVLSGTKMAYSANVEEAIAAFTGGATPNEGKIKLGAPQIAENGNTVPIKVSVESAMDGDDMVSEVLVVATGNPLPGVVNFKFTAMSGKAEASTRIRLAKTQDLVAIAKMSDGSLYQDRQTVKVTIGGCGG